MTDLNIEKLENEAMARAYDDSKPDELKDSNKEKMPEITRMSFFKISQLINDESKIMEKHFYQCFRYIKMIDCDWSCHYALLLNYKIGITIPSYYTIIYSNSSSNNLDYGIIKFKTDKEYQVEYERATKDEFESYIDELNVVSLCVENFKKNGQKFYEFENGYIYMYYNGYIWKISGYSRNDVKEYYDMYIILMSVRTIDNRNYYDKDNLKELYLISKNCLNYLYKGVDLKKKEKEEFDEFSLTEDVVTFSIENGRYLTVIDEDYQIYNRKIRKSDDNLEKIHVYCDENWHFTGTFKASILGTYNTGYLLDFTEIVDSTELNGLEKRDLLENIISQKQIELYEYKDFIRKKLLNILIDDFKRRLTIDTWNQLELVNYLYIENIDIESKTEELLYDYFKFALDNNDDELLKGLIDVNYLANKIKPRNIVIAPEFIAFSCNMLEQNKTFVLFENNEFIEWK